MVALLLFSSISRNPFVHSVKVTTTLLELDRISSKSAHPSRIVSRSLKWYLRCFDMTAAMIADSLKLNQNSLSRHYVIMLKAKTASNDIAILDAWAAKVFAASAINTIHSNNLALANAAIFICPGYAKFCSNANVV